MQYLLYNPMSGGGTCKALAENYMSRCEWETKLVDMTEIDSYSTLFKILNENAKRYSKRKDHRVYQRSGVRYRRILL